MNPPNPRTLPWDWYAGTIPDNVAIDETAYVETSFSFQAFHSRQSPGVEIAECGVGLSRHRFESAPDVSQGQRCVIHLRRQSLPCRLLLLQ